MSASNYSAADRMLHKLALGSGTIAEMSFDLEKATQKPDPDAVIHGQHVFVSGLARAGTTVLMRRFHACGVFGTLTYRDMPFVLAPGLWSKISRKAATQAKAAERAHGDGLVVDVDSPESLDEVFWRQFCKDDYIRADALVPHHADADTLDAFRTFVAAILASRANAPERYLSKSNNSILRLKSIRTAFPQALLVVPFRDPLQHAYSLLRLHRKFAQDQSDDAFIRKYMTWLAHHEFGLDHRPFVFDGQRPDGDPDSLAYWVSAWCCVYRALLKDGDVNATFVSYDQLCTDPGVWNRLAARASLTGATSGAEDLRHVTHDLPEQIPGALATEAESIHNALLGAAI